MKTEFQKKEPKGFMNREEVKKILRFYYITDDRMPDFPPAEQVRIALQGGASLIQYRNKSFSRDRHLEEAVLIREICKRAGIPLIVNDNISLAMQIMADGVHLGQEDASPAEARKILGKEAIVGATVSNLEELAGTDLSPCDYMGTGPVFPTHTKADAKAVNGLEGFRKIAEIAPVPVVAIGGITAETAQSCFEHGASGIAVISYISRAENPAENARKLGIACKTDSQQSKFKIRTSGSSHEFPGSESNPLTGQKNCLPSPEGRAGGGGISDQRI